MAIGAKHKSADLQFRIVLRFFSLIRCFFFSPAIGMTCLLKKSVLQQNNNNHKATHFRAMYNIIHQYLQQQRTQQPADSHSNSPTRTTQSGATCANANECVSAACIAGVCCASATCSYTPPPPAPISDRIFVIVVVSFFVC